MMQMGQFDVLERQRDKQRSREQDDCDLRDGAVSQLDLAHSNGFFSSLSVSRARVGRRGSIRV